MRHNLLKKEKTKPKAGTTKDTRSTKEPKSFTTKDTKVHEGNLKNFTTKETKVHARNLKSFTTGSGSRRKT